MNIREHNTEKRQKVRDLLKQGIRFKDALKQAKISSATYYYSKQGKNKPTLEVIAPAPQSKLIALIGSPSEVVEAIERLTK